MQGAPLPVVAHLLGHRNVRMTLRYAHVADKDMEAAAERIGGVLSALLDSAEQRGAQRRHRRQDSAAPAGGDDIGSVRRTPDRSDGRRERRPNRVQIQNCKTRKMR